MITQEELKKMKDENEELRSELARERAGSMKLKSEHEILVSIIYNFAKDVGQAMDLIQKGQPARRA